MTELKALYNNYKKEKIQLTDSNLQLHDNIIPFYKFKEIIIGKISTGLYKMSYYEIVKMIPKYTDLQEKILLIQIKVKIMFKIVKRKLNKYKNEFDLLEKGLIINLKKWIYEIENEIENFSFIISNDNDIEVNANKNIFQNMVGFYLEMMYVKALFYEQLGIIEKVCSLIGISINIITQTLSIITNPYIIGIIQKIYLLLINTSMSNHDYYSALITQEHLLNYCLRELLFRVDYYHGLEDEAKKKKHYKVYQTVFENITNALCLRGICKESIGKMNKAIEAYKQSKWFNMKFINDNFAFSRFITAVLKRAERYNDIIYRLKNIEIQEVKITEPTLSSILLNQYKSKIASGNYSNFNRYTKAEKIISNLKPQELDIPSQTNKSNLLSNVLMGRSNSNIMLSNIRLLDTYRHNKFQHTLHSMNKISIAYFDIDAKEKIQKAINQLTQNQNSKSKNKSHQSSPLRKHTSQHQLIMPSTPNKSSIFKGKDLSSNTECSHIKKTTATTKQNTLFSEAIQLEKYHSSLNLFSKSLKRKKKYLDKLDLKEYDFQKRVLKLRTNEKYSLSLKSKNDSEAEAYFNFNRLKNSLSSKHVKVQPNLTLKEYKEFQTLNSLENTVIKSLNTKKYTELNNRTLENRYNKKKINDSCSMIDDEYTDTIKVNQKNKKVMELISSNLQILDYETINPSFQLEKPKKNKWKKKYKTANNSSSDLSSVTKGQKVFDLMKFIKFNHKT